MIDIIKEREYWKDLEGFKPGHWYWYDIDRSNEVDSGLCTSGLDNEIFIYGNNASAQDADLVEAAPDLHRKYGEALDEIELRRNQNTVGDAQTRIALDENERLKADLHKALQIILHIQRSAGYILWELRTP